MATRDGKFGTFGGVYTPSLLTILGVIMYLRLPMVVGSAGLINAIGIILVAHVISVPTGLSISSIATDKNVGAGGPYYIVSRSLGLPIGGTLGLALFVGLSFSISLYIIGFSESFLSVLGFDNSLAAVRVCGTITIVVITLVTFISTALAIKTQYVILTLIALSLFSVFLGSPEPVPPEPHLEAPEGGRSLAELFGIFFPAVTGFTAGVNMSGDLRNPKKSIPRGTMAAIGSGLAVYLGLAIYLGYRVDPHELTENQNVLQSVALFSPLVIAGVWGATVSSALGSILGAPRILQAVASDGIMPRFLAKGFGKTHEPRNALYFAFAIGEAGILIGELDAIARIVSMIFLATYGFLNVSCAIESWASPDFRPDFRIPKFVSVIGAVTGVVVMIQLDLLAMVGATLLMAGIFLWLQRRQLRLESGDTWEGIWSSLVRSGLTRLSRHSRLQRNWRPNIVAFARDGGEKRVLVMGESLLGKSGMLTYCDLVPPEVAKRPEVPKPTDEPLVGVFRRRIVSRDPNADVANVCRFHGLPGLEPNTILLDWADYADDTSRLAELLAELREADLNQILYRHAERSDKGVPRLDVWWREGGGNLPLAVSLVRFLTASTAFERASVRFLLLSDDPASNDVLRTTTRRYLARTRVEATIRVVNTTLEVRGFDEWVRRESVDAALSIIALPNESGDADADFLSRMARLFEHVGAVLLVRQNSTFPEILSAGRPASISLLPAAPDADGARTELPPVELPSTPDLARHVGEVVEAYRRLVTTFDEECVARVYGRNIELVRRIERALEKQLTQMDKGFSKANVRRQQHMVNRAQSSFLLEALQILESFQISDLAEQQGTLEARIEAFLEAEALDLDDRRVLAVERPRADFAPSKEDTRRVAAIKRRRRWRSPIGKGPIRYKIPVGRLGTYYFDAAVRVMLRSTVQRMVADAHQLAVRLGNLLSSSKTLLAGAVEDVSADPEAQVEQRRERLVRSFDEVVRYQKERVEALRLEILSETALLLNAYARDVERIDVQAFVREERKRPEDASELRAELDAVAPAFAESQKHLFERAALAVRVSGFHHRLVTVVERQKEGLVLQLKNGTASDYRAARDALAAFSEQLRSSVSNDIARPKFSLEFESRVDPKDIIDTLTHEATATANDLPEAVRTLSDESIQALEEGRLGDVEVIDLSVRRLATFLVDTELVGPVQERVARLPELERRAITLVQDVVRLVTFQLAEFDSLGAAQPGDLAAHMLPVVENGLERLDAASGEIEDAIADLGRAMESGLEATIEGTNAYELTQSSAKLEQYIRLHQSKKAVSEAHGFVRRAAAGLRRGMVRSLYRASVGVVLARKLRDRSKSRGNIVDRVLGAVQKNRPRAEVMNALPYYYRQLFLGQALNETFWVSREAQMAQARRAVASYRQGSHGAIVVTGHGGSGKSALIQRISTKLLDKNPVYFVRPPPGGSADPRHFERAVAAALRAPGTLEEMFDHIPEQATVVIDDLELWWERSAGGLAVVDLILDLIRRRGSQYLFVLGVGRHTLSAVDRVRPLADSALSVIECDALPAESIGKIITLRHGSTGVKFELDGRLEDDLSQWQLARMFSHHFRYSRGVIGPALISWLVHVEKATGSRIAIRTPEVVDNDDLDDLRVEHKALLLQLVLHKRLTRARLERLTRLPPRQLDAELLVLDRMGLLSESRGAFEIDRFVGHIVTERLEAGGLL